MKRSALPNFHLVYRLCVGIFQCFLIFLVITVISLSFVAFYRYLISSPHLRLEQVVIKGVSESIRKDLVQGCQLSSSLSLLSINLNELKYKMEEHPWVRSVTLERHFPHTLIVIAEEQKPSALVAIDKFYYMNRWGEIFKEVHDSDDVNLPVITGASQIVAEQKRQLRRAGYVLRSLEQKSGPYSLEGLSEIHVEENGCMSLYFIALKAEVRMMCSLLPMENGKWQENKDSYLEKKIGGLIKVTEFLKREDRISQVIRIDLDYRDGAVVSFKES